VNYDAVLLEEREPGIWLLTVNRPKALNALAPQVLDDIAAATREVAANASARCLLVTGAGERAFIAGADIAAMSAMTVLEGREFALKGHATLRAFELAPIPVIALVNGFALGGGCELALACDIVVAAESARFALPEIKLAILPGAGGTQRLPRAIGKAKTMDLCLSARVLDAAQADRYGLVSRVVPDAQLIEATLALASQIAGYSLPALMAIKESVNRAYESPLSEGIGFERRQLHARFASDDAHEGMKAFLEKRPPVFTHR